MGPDVQLLVPHHGDEGRWYKVDGANIPAAKRIPEKPEILVHL
jgi:hypothetical protein